MQQYRALILRSNRFLGSALVDKKFVTVGDLEEANGRFMEAVQNSELQKASILSILVNELEKIDEGRLIEAQVDDDKLGLVDLSFLKLQSLRKMEVDFDACWASWTVPFDLVDGTYLLASCYHLSAPVKKFWEELLKGKIIWYVSSVRSIMNAFSQLEEIHKAEIEEEAEAAEEAALEQRLNS